MSWRGDLLKAGISSDGERVKFFNSTLFNVDVIETEVDASGGGSAQTTAIGTIPANSILLAVICEVTQTFNGDTTQTIEVGITGNIDKYIDTVDIDPGSGTPQISNFDSTTADQNAPEYLSAAADIIATWTNTASASAGTATVRLIYISLTT